jgi:hypothetical protein
MTDKEGKISEDEYKLMAYKLGRAWMELTEIKVKLSEVIEQMDALQDELASAIPKGEREQ